MSIVQNLFRPPNPVNKVGSSTKRAMGGPVASLLPGGATMLLVSRKIVKRLVPNAVWRPKGLLFCLVMEMKKLVPGRPRIRQSVA